MKQFRTVLLCFLFFTILGCDSLEEKKSKYLQRGEKHLESGDLEKARIEIKNLLQIDSESAKAHNLYAQIEEKRKQFGVAFSHYLKANQLDPSNADVKYRLGKLYLLSNKPEEAMDLADSVLQSDPNNADAGILKIASLARIESPAAAIEDAQKLVASHPNKDTAIILLAGLYREENKSQDAVKTLKNALVSLPKSTSIRLMLASIFLEQKNLSEVERFLEEILEIQPDNYEISMQLVRLYATQKRYAEAYAILDRSVQQVPNDHKRKLYLADLVFVWKGLDEAEKKLKQYIKEFPEIGILNLELASLYKNTDQSEKAKSLYRAIIKKSAENSDRLKAMNLLAKQLMEERDIEGSKKLVDEILRINPKDYDTLMLSGKIALLRQDYSSAVTKFRSLIGETPDSSETLLFLAQAHSLNNEPALALEALDRTIELEPENRKNRLALVDFFLKSSNYPKALEHINALLAVFPDDLYAINLKSKMLLATNNMDDAYRHIQKNIERHSDDFRLQMQLAEICLLRKDFKQAIKTYERVIELSPKYYEGYLGLTQASLQDKQEKKIHEKLVRLADTDVGEYAELLLGIISNFQNNISTAKQHYKKAIKKNPQWVHAYITLGASQISEGQYEKAAKTYQEGLSNVPDNQSLRIALAVSYSKAGQIDNAIKQYETILDSSPGDAIAANNLAVLLSEGKGDKESLQLAVGLIKPLASSGNPPFLDTLGWIFYKLDDTKQAISLLEQAVNKKPTSAIYSYHLGMAYLKAGRKILASKYLEKSLSQKGSFTGSDIARKTFESISSASD